MHPREPSGGLGPTAPTPYPRGGRRRTPPSRPATRRRASTSSGTSRARPPRPASRRGARRRPSNDNAAPRQHSRRLTGDRPAGGTAPRPGPTEIRRSVLTHIRTPRNGPRDSASNETERRSATGARPSPQCARRWTRRRPAGGPRCPGGAAPDSPRGDGRGAGAGPFDAGRHRGGVGERRTEEDTARGDSSGMEIDRPPSRACRCVILLAHDRRTGHPRGNGGRSCRAVEDDDGTTHAGRRPNSTDTPPRPVQGRRDEPPSTDFASCASPRTLAIEMPQFSISLGRVSVSSVTKARRHETQRDEAFKSPRNDTLNEVRVSI